MAQAWQHKPDSSQRLYRAAQPYMIPEVRKEVRQARQRRRTLWRRYPELEMWKSDRRSFILSCKLLAPMSGEEVCPGRKMRAAARGSGSDGAWCWTNGAT